jgi:hypothetical protein
MKHKKKEPAAKYIKVADIKTEPVPHEVEAIAQPYIRAIVAALSGRNEAEAFAAVKNLPYEKRYLARVLTALELAFCDFDTASLRMDFASLTSEELESVAQQIAVRGYQFNLLTKAIFEFVGGAA